MTPFHIISLFRVQTPQEQNILLKPLIFLETKTITILYFSYAQKVDSSHVVCKWEYLHTKYRRQLLSLFFSCWSFWIATLGDITTANPRLTDWQANKYKQAIQWALKRDVPSDLQQRERERYYGICRGTSASTMQRCDFFERVTRLEIVSNIKN